MSPWELFTSWVFFIRRTCLNVSLYPMPTTAILQYLKLIGYAFQEINWRFGCLSTCYLQPQQTEANFQVIWIYICHKNKQMETTCSLKSAWQCHFFIVKRGGGVYVTAKNLKQTESPTYTKNRKLPLQFHNARFYNVQYLCSQRMWVLKAYLTRSTCMRMVVVPSWLSLNGAIPVPYRRRGLDSISVKLLGFSGQPDQWTG